MESYTFRFQTTTFPNKLWFLVNDPQFKSICWDASGKKILICEETFKAEVLFSPKQLINKLFKTKDFTSIIRQLNIYGFKKLNSDQIDPEEHLSTTSNVAKTPPLPYPKVIQHFNNPNFIRSKPELLGNLKRRVCTKAKRDAAVDGSRRPPRHCPYPLLNSHQESSAVINNGTVSVVPPQTPSPQHYNGHGHIQKSTRTPNNVQAFPVGHGSLSSSQQASQSTVPTRLYRPLIPYPSQSRFNTPVISFLSPQFFQQRAASYPPYGYYPVRADGVRSEDNTKAAVHQTPLEGQHQ